MLKLRVSGRYKRGYRKAAKRNKDVIKLDRVVEMILTEKVLPEKYYNHKLSGNHQGKWECHIEPDWLLVYEIKEGALWLCDTGSHSDLF